MSNEERTGREERLAKVLSNLFRVAEEAIRPGMTRDETPTWDSLSHLQMVMALEDAFSVEFTTSEAVAIESVQDILDLLESKGAE